mmetsp:Transcript_6907/g.10874  ORF Transcript_6907/g.10874 Transcript_6907/m.10874 type:complete len:325 (+) Transcript_6907:35-1009(+)
MEAAWSRVFMLAQCISGVYVSFMLHAFYQEKLYVHPYSGDGKKFDSTTFLLLCQSVFSTAFAAAVFFMRPGSHQLSGVPMLSYLKLSMAQSSASFCSYQALRYVTYPTQVIVKSCKMVPVMVVSTIIAKKRYNLRQYISVAGISGGIIMFMIGKSKSKSGLSTNNPFGILLSCISLSLDGFTGGYQDKLKESHHPSANELALFMNLNSIPLLLIASIFTGHGKQGLQYCMENPLVLRDISLMCLFFSIGQHFIFKTVTNFGSLACTMMTTTRKFVTILLSVVWYGHALRQLQWAGVGLVFAALSLELYAKYVQEKERQRNRRQE